MLNWSVKRLVAYAKDLVLLVPGLFSSAMSEIMDARWEGHPCGQQDADSS